MADTCSACDTPVVNAVTLGGLVRQLIPDPAGNHIIETLPDGARRARVLMGTEMPATVPAYRMHECPAVTPPGPPCNVCGLPMDRELARLERWDCHPACDTTEARDAVRRAIPRTRKGRR